MTSLVAPKTTTVEHGTHTVITVEPVLPLTTTEIYIDAVHRAVAERRKRRMSGAAGRLTP